jgi:hypothetical protein
MEIIAVLLLVWWGWSVWYKRRNKPVPVVVSPLGMREGNYSQAVPAVGNKNRGRRG